MVAVIAFFFGFVLYPTSFFFALSWFSFTLFGPRRTEEQESGDLSSGFHSRCKSLDRRISRVIKNRGE